MAPLLCIKPIKKIPARPDGNFLYNFLQENYLYPIHFLLAISNSQ